MLYEFAFQTSIGEKTVVSLSRHSLANLELVSWSQKGDLANVIVLNGRETITFANIPPDDAKVLYNQIKETAEKIQQEERELFLQEKYAPGGNVAIAARRHYDSLQ